MKRTRIVASTILGALMACLLLALPAFARDAAITQGNLSVDVESIQAQPAMNQGETYSLAWNFTLATTKSGVALQEGDIIEAPSNIGELFTASAEGGYDALEPFILRGQGADGADVTLATVTVRENKVIFTVGAGGSNMLSLSGQIITTNSFTAKDLGATEDSAVHKTLTIGNASTEIEFREKGTVPPGSSSLSLVDIDTFWKNMWNNGNDLTVGIASMEVNPIGSLDLYGSTTRKVDEVASYQNLFLKDQIPEHGFIDLDSMQIYAAVPVLAVNTGADYVDQWHGNYSIPHGSYFAQRAGTLRYPIKERMTKLEQSEGETLEAFEHRVRAQQLSWGVYTAEDKTQTFLCNFGNVGDIDRANGITYESLGGLGAEYARDYPEIFGAQGASGGNVVSYYVEFNTYYPEIVGLRKGIQNTAELTQAPDADTKPVRVGGNTATYQINNGGGMGTARTNELMVKLIDDQTGEPLAGAGFKVQQQTADGSWVDTGIEGVTDANGMLTGGDVDDEGRLLSVGPFLNGTYRVVQTSWLHGYEETSTFRPSDNEKNNTLDDRGVFTVTGAERYGFATVVTNCRKTGSITLTPQDMVAYTGGDSLSADSFPAVRYAVEGVNVDACDEITFTIDGKTAQAQRAGAYWVLTALENTFVLDGAPMGDDGAAGDYTVSPTYDAISAEGADGTRYEVTVAGTATLRVRNVSDPDGVLGETVDVAQPVVHDASDVDTSDGIGQAVIAEDTTYYTNGDAALGVLGDHESTSPQVSLLFDKLIPTNDAGEDTEAVLRDRAADEGYELTEDNSEFRYLDLVNENDGNAWMSTDDGAQITIYWPVPEGVDASECTFEVLHFAGLHREYRGDMQAQVEACDVDPIACRVEGNNVVFTLTGDQDQGCFSPFALVWEKREDSTHEEGETPEADDDGNASQLPDTGDSSLWATAAAAIGGTTCFVAGELRRRRGHRLER